MAEVRIDIRSCFQCKWLGNDRMNLGPCNRCVDHSLYEPINKEEKPVDNKEYIEVDPSIGEKVNNIKWEKDAINPDHYKNQTSLECIEAMEIIFGKAAVLDFCLCNSWKYIWRYKNKNGEEDLVKAGWYLAYAYGYIASNDNRFGLLKRMIHYVTEHGVEVKYNG